MSDQTKQQETRSLPATFAKNEFEKDAFILRQLVTKDFKIKYRRSVLGVAWSVLNPLLMMIVMAIVFSTIFGQGRNGSMTPEMYPLYLIVGNITFAVMSESTNQALTSIVGAAPLLKKVKVHRWVFPVQKVLFSLHLHHLNVLPQVLLSHLKHCAVPKQTIQLAHAFRYVQT